MSDVDFDRVYSLMKCLDAVPLFQMSYIEPKRISNQCFPRGIDEMFRSLVRRKPNKEESIQPASMKTESVITKSQEGRRAHRRSLAASRKITVKKRGSVNAKEDRCKELIGKKNDTISSSKLLHSITSELRSLAELPSPFGSSRASI